MHPFIETQKQWLRSDIPAFRAGEADDSFFTHLHAVKAMANVTVSPGRAGPVEIAIQLENADELPLAADAVSVTLAPKLRRVPPTEITAGDADGHDLRICSGGQNRSGQHPVRPKR